MRWTTRIDLSETQVQVSIELWWIFEPCLSRLELKLSRLALELLELAPLSMLVLLQLTPDPPPLVLVLLQPVPASLRLGFATLVTVSLSRSPHRWERLSRWRLRMMRKIYWAKAGAAYFLLQKAH
jgi:hypothetical protein